MNKQAQEELVGFVLVVVVVSVIFLVLIGISTYSNSATLSTESTEISQFVDSIKSTTSSCAIGWEPNFVPISELIKQCNSGAICTSGETACDTLQTDLSSFLNTSWNVGIDRPVSWYEFKAEYVTPSGEVETISGTEVASGEFLTGGCPGSETRKGVTRPIGDPDVRIRINFFICETEL